MRSAYIPAAFPVPTERSEDGMTLRDHFAGKALPGVLQICIEDEPRDGETMPQMFARKSFEIADAMLAERKKGGAA